MANSTVGSAKVVLFSNTDGRSQQVIPVLPRSVPHSSTRKYDPANKSSVASRVSPAVSEFVPDLGANLFMSALGQISISNMYEYILYHAQTEGLK